MPDGADLDVRQGAFARAIDAAPCVVSPGTAFTCERRPRKHVACAAVAAAALAADSPPAPPSPTL